MREREREREREKAREKTEKKPALRILPFFALDLVLDLLVIHQNRRHRDLDLDLNQKRLNVET